MRKIKQLFQGTATVVHFDDEHEFVDLRKRSVSLPYPFDESDLQDILEEIVDYLDYEVNEGDILEVNIFGYNGSALVFERKEFVCEN